MKEFKTRFDVCNETPTLAVFSIFSNTLETFYSDIVVVNCWGDKCFANRARHQSRFPTFISCQRQDANVLPQQRQSHQGDKLYDVSTVLLVACWPVLLARGSHADGEPHSININWRFVGFEEVPKLIKFSITLGSLSG